MNEIILKLNVTGGHQLAVSKEGSQLMARCQFGAIQLDSAVEPGSLTPTDYDLKISGKMSGSGHQFCDQLVRYPLIIALNEILPKDKKQKEDKIVPHATFTMDLISFLNGTKKISDSFSAQSSEVPGQMISFDVEVEIEKQFEASFLGEEYRILTIKILNAGNVPETWVGNNFTASLPIPKENNETIGVNFVGKSENGVVEGPVQMNWHTLDGAYCPKPNGTCKLAAKEDQNGEKINHPSSGPMICWNTERRVLMSKNDCDVFQNRISKFAKFLPVEIARAKEPEGTKKGKGKQEENEFQNHGISLVNLSPLLYPGVASVKGAFSIQGFTDHVLSASGYVSSIAEELNRCGSSLNIDQRVRSAKPKPNASNSSDISERKSTANPDSAAYHEMQTSLYFEFILSRPFVERRKLSDLSSNLASIIPKRETLPRKKFGADASVNEFHSVIADIGRKVLEDIRNFRKIPSEEDAFHDSLMYKMNKSGKYSEYHEQLKYSVIRIVREKYLKTQNFTSDEEFKTFLEVLYVFLMKEMHKSLNQTVVQDAPMEPERVATLDELQNAAIFAEKMEDYNKANYLWTELLARDDSSPFSWRGLARVALRVGDVDRAHEALQQAVSLDHTDPWTIILAAQVARQLGDIQQTKILLDRASANPDSQDQTESEDSPRDPIERGIAFILLGNIYEEELNQELAEFSRLEACRLAKHVTIGEPGQEIYLLGAEMFEKSSQRGFSQQMLAQYLASLDVSQEIPGRALLLKSKLEVQSANYEGALDTIHQATTCDHSNSSVWAQLGRIHLTMGNIEEAKTAFQRAVAYEKEPEDPVVVFCRLARILENEKQFAEARKYYLMACEICPTVTAWLGVGKCSLRLDQLCEAEDALAEANLLDPLDAEVWGYLSLLCLRTNRKLEAEQSYKFASKLELNDETLLDEIKHLQIRIGFGDPSY